MPVADVTVLSRSPRNLDSGVCLSRAPDLSNGKFKAFAGVTHDLPDRFADKRWRQRIRNHISESGIRHYDARFSIKDSKTDGWGIEDAV